MLLRASERWLIPWGEELAPGQILVDCARKCGLRVCGTAQWVPISSLKRSLVQLRVWAALWGGPRPTEPLPERPGRSCQIPPGPTSSEGPRPGPLLFGGVYVRILVSKDSARKKQRGREDVWELLRVQPSPYTDGRVWGPEELGHLPWVAQPGSSQLGHGQNQASPAPPRLHQILGLL